MICSVVVRRRADGSVGPHDLGLRLDRGAELAPPDGEDSPRAADLVLLGSERHRLVGLLPRFVHEVPRVGVVGENVPVARLLHRLGALHDLEPEVERVAPEDVPHVVAADDHQLEPRLLGHPLEAGRAHLARGADREAVAGDDEGLPRMNPLAEVGHQEAERSLLPSLVERIEALRDAVLGGRDLVRVDGVELPARPLRIPEDEGPAPDRVPVPMLRALAGRRGLAGPAGMRRRGVSCRRPVGPAGAGRLAGPPPRWRRGKVLEPDAGFEAGGLDRLNGSARSPVGHSLDIRTDAGPRLQAGGPGGPPRG